MKNRILLILVLLAGITATEFFGGFKNDDVNSQSKIAELHRTIFEVVKNDVPFNTEKFTRIGYTLKMWEYEKDGMTLEKVVVFDNNTKAELFTIQKSELPPIYKDPLSAPKEIKVDKIDAYYMSIQLPIPLGQVLPSVVSHRLFLKDTVNNLEVIREGGVFSPRKNEKPLVINSPVKGENWIFFNQSTLLYHFYTLFFVDGKIGCGERYASDLLKLNDQDELYKGDPKVNESYFCYRDTLYAVADAIVHHTVDGLPENKGDARDVKFNTVEEYAGNYIILDIGNGNYAVYVHCVTGSIIVKKGDKIKEGSPIALLGNSGNSTSAHLHFSINDGPDFFMSNGLPFMLKQYEKNREVDAPEFKGPLKVSNSMMEEKSVVKF